MLEQMHFYPSKEHLHKYEEKTDMQRRQWEKCIIEKARKVKQSPEALSYALCFDLGEFHVTSDYQVYSA